jgi:bifunctional NMN adenylyltransferase/nudix hydrolase
MEIQRVKSDVGVIVGRFQVAELTEAHFDLIKTVCNEHAKVLLFLGLSPAIGTRNNPLDLECRRQMIEQQLNAHNPPITNVTILYIKDVPSDEVWTKNLNNMVRDNLNPGQTAILYGSRDSFIKHYTGGYQTQELIPERVISGSEMRKNISKRTKNTKDFREGVIWAVYNQYPKVFATVDIAPVDIPNQTVLLGRKENENKLRFVGGFAMPESRSYEQDAVRELEEETGIKATEESLVYIGSTFVDDWRYRSEIDKIKTIFFFVPHPGGSVKADDDIAEVRWVKISDLTEDMLVDTHKPLYHLFRQFIRKNNLLNAK